MFSWILTKGGGKAELGRENFNPCFLGFQLEFLCQTELLKREFQSLFSWISTESREGVLKRSLKLSILVFLDFNMQFLPLLCLRKAHFNPCFLGFQRHICAGRNQRSTISILVFLDFNTGKREKRVASLLQFQSLFSWILTSITYTASDSESSLSILVFLDFNKTTFA